MAAKKTEIPPKTPQTPATPATPDESGITASPGSVHGIRVRSFQPTFRRAGFEFTREGIDLRLDSLTDEQVQAIIEEPMLSYTGIYMSDEAEPNDDDSVMNDNGNGISPPETGND